MDCVAELLNHFLNMFYARVDHEGVEPQSIAPKRSTGRFSGLQGNEKDTRCPLFLYPEFCTQCGIPVY